jgi:uncharacterized protein (DUF1778 family)
MVSRITVRLDPDTDRRLRQAARASGKNESDLIVKSTPETL